MRCFKLEENDCEVVGLNINTGTRTLSSSLNYWFWNLEKIVSTTLSRDYLANVLEAFILLRLHLVRNSTVVNFTSPFSDTYWFMIAKKKFIQCLRTFFFVSYYKGRIFSCMNFSSISLLVSSNSRYKPRWRLNKIEQIHEAQSLWCNNHFDVKYDQKFWCGLFSETL